MNEAGRFQKEVEIRKEEKVWKMFPVFAAFPLRRGHSCCYLWQLLLLLIPTLSGLKDWRPEFGTFTEESRRGNPKIGESERKIPKFHV